MKWLVIVGHSLIYIIMVPIISSKCNLFKIDRPCQQATSLFALKSYPWLYSPRSWGRIGMMAMLIDLSDTIRLGKIIIFIILRLTANLAMIVNKQRHDIDLSCVPRFSNLAIRFRALHCFVIEFLICWWGTAGMGTGEGTSSQCRPVANPPPYNMINLRCEQVPACIERVWTSSNTFKTCLETSGTLHEYPSLRGFTPADPHYRYGCYNWRLRLGVKTEKSPRGQELSCQDSNLSLQR